MRDSYFTKENYTSVYGHDRFDFPENNGSLDSYFNKLNGFISYMSEKFPQSGIGISLSDKEYSLFMSFMSDSERKTYDEDSAQILLHAIITTFQLENSPKTFKEALANLLN